VVSALDKLPIIAYSRRKKPLVSRKKALKLIKKAKIENVELRENTMSAMYKHDNDLCRARIAGLEDALGELLSIHKLERFNPHDQALVNRCTAAWEAVQRVLSK
jgi:predicted xylose isomerase-like sugar epimerase